MMTMTMPTTTTTMMMMVVVMVVMVIIVMISTGFYLINVHLLRLLPINWHAPLLSIRLFSAH